MDSYIVTLRYLDGASTIESGVTLEQLQKKINDFISPDTNVSVIVINKLIPERLAAIQRAKEAVSPLSIPCPACGVAATVPCQDSKGKLQRNVHAKRKAQALNG